MNILYVNTKARWGGICTWMTRTALALEKRGHSVWILSAPETKLYRSKPAGIKILPATFGMDYNPLSILNVAHFIYKNKIDVVVTNVTKEISIGGVAARLCGIASLRRIGNYTDLVNRRKVRFLHRFVNHNIIPCQAIYDQAQKAYGWLNQDNFTVIYNGVEVPTLAENEVQDLRQKWGVPAGSLIIGMTTQLVPLKGIKDALLAFSRLHHQYPYLYLVISGEGPEHDYIVKTAWELHINNRVILPGFQKKPGFAAQAYDIGLMTSYDEGFPNTLVEFCAVGLPVISTRIGGIPEIIEHEKNGFLIQPRDVDALTLYLQKLIENPELRESLGKAAQETSLSQFTETHMIDQLEAIYQRYCRK